MPPRPHTLYTSCALLVPPPLQTGYVKGYALVEYAKEEEARAAIKAMDGSELLTTTIHVTWAFVNKGGGRGGGAGSRPRPRR